MVVKVFPFNPVINSMQYDGAKQELTICFVKASTGTRVYENVPREIFYGIYYLTKTEDLLSYYSKNIKQKFQLITKK